MIDSALPAHMLLRKEKTADHNTRPQANATQSVFESFNFGPLDLDNKKGQNQVAAASAFSNPLSNPKVFDPTILQEVE